MQQEHAVGITRTETNSGVTWRFLGRNEAQSDLGPGLGPAFFGQHGLWRPHA